jgi:hypothetical protein
MEGGSGMVVLIVLIVAVVIIGLISLTFVLIEGSESLNTINQPCDQISTTGLLNTTGLPCVVVNGVTTSDKLSVGYQPLAVITPNPYPYKTACATLCGRVANGHCVDNSGNIDEMLDPTYQSCLTKLAPTQCVGVAMPVGYSGNTFYYVKTFYTDDVQTGTCV